ncbi:MAG: glycosyltransferase [Candidatus Bipolaricaulia bacterium]
MVEASVIIPTHNRREILRRNLEHLNQQRVDRSRFEVIVADDGSTDETAEMIADLDVDLDLHYLYQEKRGAAAARNKAIDVSRGKLIIFIDSDILASENLVGEHMRSHRVDGKIIVQGPVIHTHNLENLSQARRKIFDLYFAPFATGNSSVAKRYLIQAGKFDERFQEYGWEDPELGIRLKALGLKSKRNRRAIGYHYQKKNSVKNLDQLCAKERQRGHTAIQFYRKHPIFEVKNQIMLRSPFWWLDRMLTLGGWTDKPGTRRFLETLEERGHDHLLTFFMKIIKTHHYFEGMRERLDSLNSG